MGLFDSKSDSAGGMVGSSDAFANNNAYAGAPVVNYTDTRKASGKYAINKEAELNFYVTSTDYGAVHDSFVLAQMSLESGIESQRIAADLQNRALDQVSDFSDNTLYLMSENAQELMQHSKEISAYSADAISNNLDSALMFAEKQSQPDKGIFSDSIKYLIYGGVALFGFAAWSSKRG